MANLFTKLTNLNPAGKTFISLINSDSTQITLTLNAHNIKLNSSTLRAYLKAMDENYVSIESRSPSICLTDTGTAKADCKLRFFDGSEWVLSAYNDDFGFILPEGYLFTEYVAFENGSRFSLNFSLDRFVAFKDKNLPLQLANRLEAEGSKKHGDIIKRYEKDNNTKVVYLDFEDAQTGEIVRNIDYKEGNIYSYTSPDYLPIKL